ncbi:MAG TPA: carbohydrate kinase family protein [Thermoleophilaceae bacterium]|jgi:sugar/nucleoside kinase (ribokinase family)|nr:carbohydrate kinase family protein [Thermoleophilaceae bacterium]
MRPEPQPEVLCAGIVVADAIASPVDEPPERGLLALVDSVLLATGGCALSTATALVELGTPTALCGRVGRDLLGDVMRREAQARGLGTENLRECDELTSASLVLDASDGARTFLHNPGASAALTPEDVERALVPGVRWLHIGGALVLPSLDGEPLAGVLGRARERGITTSLDPVHDATGRWDRAHPSLPHLDLICPNLGEARGITGQESAEDCAHWLRERGVARVAIKMGRDGAYALDEDTAEMLPAFAVDTRDETGAGDAFAAGLIHGLLQGWPLERAVRLGNAVGALSTRGLGASSTLPDLEEALAL